jgi:hypothetical protein
MTDIGQIGLSTLKNIYIQHLEKTHLYYIYTRKFPVYMCVYNTKVS